uniref:Uncharacterized protein n=1 Tax=Oryza meridionalis TaxID=40149 RepID=A0A0E0CZV7_9ORYZ
MAHMFRIQCRASDDFSLAIVNGEVWRKDARYSCSIKDEAGRPTFALVNKATGDALKHSLGYWSPVRVIKFEPGYLDESVLWAEGGDTVDGYRRIHMMNNADYIFDAEEAIPPYGGARNGTRLILFRWNGGLNQLWRMVPCGGDVLEHEKPLRVVCHSNQALCLSVRDGAVVLADIDHKDPKQQWIVSFQNTRRVTDAEGHRSFVLMNWSTGKAMKRSGDGEPVELVGHSLDSVDVALLWTRGNDLGEEFYCIRTVCDVGLVLDAAGGVPEFGGAHDGTQIIVFPCHGGANQRRLWCEEEAAANAAWLGGIVQRTAQVVRIGEQVGMGDGRVGFSLVGYWVGMEHAFRIQCRASDDLSVAIVNGEVILAKSDPRDNRQARPSSLLLRFCVTFTSFPCLGHALHVWHKDVRYSAGLKDEAGRLAFALVNKATGEAIKHSFGYNHPVRLVKFEPGYLDESVLWTESEDTGDGFHRIHMINNADYIFDGARDGTRLILFRWNGGDNQLWRMAPCIGAEPDHEPPVHVVYQSNQNLCLTVRHGAVVLARIDHKDPKQHWTVSFRNTGRVTDEEGHRSFLLLNPSTGKAMKRSADKEQPVELVGHGPDSVDVALLWTRSDNVGEGFHCIRTVSDVSLVLDAAGGGKHDGTPIIVFPTVARTRGGLCFRLTDRDSRFFLRAEAPVPFSLGDTEGE